MVESSSTSLLTVVISLVESETAVVVVVVLRLNVSSVTRDITSTSSLLHMT